MKNIDKLLLFLFLLTIIPILIERAYTSDLSGVVVRTDEFGGNVIENKFYHKTVLIQDEANTLGLIVQANCHVIAETFNSYSNDSLVNSFLTLAKVRHPNDCRYWMELSVSYSKPCLIDKRPSSSLPFLEENLHFQCDKKLSKSVTFKISEPEILTRVDCNKEFSKVTGYYYNKVQECKDLSEKVVQMILSKMAYALDKKKD